MISVSGKHLHSLSVPTAVTCAWGLLMGLVWLPSIDPLLGLGLGGYMASVGCQIALAAFVAIAFCYRWRWLGALLAGLAFFLAAPVPSKSGFEVRVSNATDTLAEVTVARTDIPSRRIVIAVAAGQTVVYPSAPGDYLETFELTVEHGRHCLTTTVAELRTHELRVTDSGILLSGAPGD